MVFSKIRVNITKKIVSSHQSTGSSVMQKENMLAPLFHSLGDNSPFFFSVEIYLGRYGDKDR